MSEKPSLQEKLSELDDLIAQYPMTAIDIKNWMHDMDEAVRSCASSLPSKARTVIVNSDSNGRYWMEQEYLANLCEMEPDCSVELLIIEVETVKKLLVGSDSTDDECGEERQERINDNKELHKRGLD